MCPVESTPEYALAVVPHRPFYYWLIGFTCFVLAVLLAVASYYSGYYRGASTELAAIEERDTLSMAYATAEKEIQQLEQSVANLTLGSQVDRTATEQVRADVVRLKNEMAELQRDNTFYRDLMRPESDEVGVSIEPPLLRLFPDSSNTYDYQMMVKQVSSNRPQLSGYIEVTLVGTMEGDEENKEQRFELHQLSIEQDSAKIKLKFRYFQRIEGRMVLPKGFVPERLDLKMVSLQPKKALVEKKFTWVVDEV